jgi:hypothetical protein
MPDLHAGRPIDDANLLAGHAVAAATAFLGGRHDWKQLLGEVDRLQASLLAIDDIGTHQILQPLRLLVIAMRGMALAAQAHDVPTAPPLAVARLDRWEQVTASLVELVRAESMALRQQTAGAGR